MRARAQAGQGARVRRCSRSAFFTSVACATRWGWRNESLALPNDVRTVGDLRVHVAARHRAYAESIDCVRVARNEAFAEDREVLADGDV